MFWRMMVLIGLSLSVGLVATLGVLVVIRRRAHQSTYSASRTPTA